MEKHNVSEEQISYANILNIITWTGLAILIVTFIIYISGILPCFIPIEDISKYWDMKAKDYIHILNAPTGWGWIAMIGKGDYLNFVGIAILAGLTILCYLRILPILMKKKDTPYVIIVILEVAVFNGFCLHRCKLTSPKNCLTNIYRRNILLRDKL